MFSSSAFDVNAFSILAFDFGVGHVAPSFDALAFDVTAFSVLAFEIEEPAPPFIPGVRYVRTTRRGRSF
jgi:hypothetical protein